MIWLGLSNSREKYALRYESKYMKELGNALEYIAGIGVSAAVKEGLKHTILSGKCLAKFGRVTNFEFNSYSMVQLLARSEGHLIYFIKIFRLWDIFLNFCVIFPAFNIIACLNAFQA